MRGAKVMSLTVDMFNIRFIDSLNFFPMKLANLPKTFGIEELKKNHFPHFFNKKENENYVGPIPPTSYYNPNGMSPKDREAFMTWHASKEESNYIFNFQEEILAYCRSDVDILRRCCLEFRELFHYYYYYYYYYYYLMFFKNGSSSEHLRTCFSRGRSFKKFT